LYLTLIQRIQGRKICQKLKKSICSLYPSKLVIHKKKWLYSLHHGNTNTLKKSKCWLLC